MLLLSSEAARLISVQRRKSLQTILMLRSLQVMDAIGGVLPAGEDAEHLRQLQPYAAQQGETIELNLAVFVDDHQAAACFTAGGNQAFLQGIRRGNTYHSCQQNL